MDGIEGLFEALGRLLVQNASRQTADTLAGNGTLLDQLWAHLQNNAVVWLIQAAFLFVGVLARSILAGFGQQMDILWGILVGAPPEVTYQLGVVQAGVKVTQGIALAALPVAIAWRGIGWEFGWDADDKADAVKRLFGGGVLVVGLPVLLARCIDAVDAIGRAIAGAAGATAVPAYQSITDAVGESLVVVGAAGTSALGGPAIPVAQAVAGLASQPTTAAGPGAVLYAGALVLGGLAALVRIGLLDALYVVAPLAAVLWITPIGDAIFRSWGKAFGFVLLLAIPASFLMLAAGAVADQLARGGPTWTFLVGIASVGGYALTMGKVTGAMTFGLLSVPGKAHQVVKVVGAVGAGGALAATAAAATSPPSPGPVAPLPPPAWGGYWPMTLKGPAAQTPAP